MITDSPKKRIGIINSGGDCSGMNAVISSLVKTGLTSGEYEFIGFRKGWEGLLNPITYVDLNYNAIKGISHLGGTILGTVNKGRFAGKVGADSKFSIPTEILHEAKQNYEDLGLEALVVIGGDGTLSAAVQLKAIGVNIVGIPKSIDNDLLATDMTFGFGSAVNTITDALEHIDSTANSHDRVMVIETMGRYSGWLALYGGLGGGAQVILIPEIPFDITKVVEFLNKRKTYGLNATMIVVAEGAKEKGGNVISKSQTTEADRLGGISEFVMKRIDDIAPGEFEMRNVVLGHLQRGGSPTPMDKILSYRYGVRAMEAITNKEYGKMVCLKGNHIVTVDIEKAVKGLKKVSPKSELVKAAKNIGISFGD